MKAFENVIKVPIAGRAVEKPRSVGLTMVLDKGLSPREAEDLAERAGDYIDIVKLSFGTARVMNSHLVEKKVSTYVRNRIDVMPGGTLFETSVAQGTADKYIKEAKKLGFTAIEISDGTVTIGIEERCKLIRMTAENGLKVISEVGKKDPTKDLVAEEYVSGIKRDIEFGAFRVLIEAREGGHSVGIFDKKGGVKEDKLNKIVESVDVEKVIFEAPRKPQQVYFIKRFGVNVNLGNVMPEDAVALEALRQGLRGDTLRLVYR